jgi:hypothetical protein
VGFVILQATPARAAWVARRVGWLFVANCALNSFWLVAFAREWAGMWVSVAVIFAGVLAPLIAIYVRMDPGVPHAAPAALLPRLAGGKRATPPRRVTPAELVFGHTFFSVYMGWGVVACVANVAIALTPRGGPPPALAGASPSAWSIALQLVAALLALAALATRLDAAFVAPIAWALLAIASQQASPEYPGTGDVVACARTLGWLLAAAAAAAAAWRVWLWRTGVTAFAHSVEEGEDGTGAAGGDSSAAVGKGAEHVDGADSMTARLHLGTAE